MSERSPINLNKLVKNILTICSLLLVGFLLWYFRIVTIYIVCGVILSLVARPLYSLLERISIRKFKIPSVINALLSILLVWAVLGGVGALVIPIIVKEGVKVSKVNPEKLISQLETPINNVVKKMQTFGLIAFEELDTTKNVPIKTVERTIIYKLPCDSLSNATFTNGGIIQPEIDTVTKVSTTLPVANNDSVQTGIAHRKEIEGMIKTFAMKYISFKQVSSWFGSAFLLLGNMLATIVSASFLAFFFLRDKGLLKNIVITIMPAKYEKQTLTIMTESRKILSRYFIGLMLELILVMVCVTIGMLIIGLNFELAIAIGFFVGLFNIVPYVGPIIGGVIGLFMGISNYLDADVYATILPLMGKMALVFWITQLLDNNIFQTVIFSNSVKAHPIEIFLVIVLAGSMSGIVGMIFAIPVYSVLRIIAKQFLGQFKMIRSLTQDI